MPVHMDTWKAGSQTPLVAYAPAGIDDMEMKEVTAFDAQGKVHRLDAETPPKEPVIVLAINERTDAEGNLLGGFVTPNYIQPPDYDPNCGGGGGGGNGDDDDPTVDLGARESGDQEYIYQVEGGQRS